MIIYHHPQFCLQCEAQNLPFHQEIEDNIYSVPGRWNLVRCSNPDCQVIFLDHDLTADEIADFYKDYSTHSIATTNASGLKKLYRDLIESCWARYHAYPLDSRAVVASSLFYAIPYFRDIVHRRIFWLDYKKDGRLVEVGFGDSHNLLRMRDLGWDVTGVEFDPTCIKQAQRYNLNVKTGSLEVAKFADSSFDAVIASHAIEHLTNVDVFMEEAFRILKENGQLVLTTPNGLSLGSKWAGRDWRGLEVPRHLAIQNFKSLRAIAQKHGFRDIEIKGTHQSGFMLQQTVQQKLGWKISRSQNFGTVIFNIIGSMLTALCNSKSEEIVLKCKK